MDTIGVSQTDFLSGEISMTFDLEKARDAAKFDDRMAITMFPLAIAEIERLRAEISEQKGMIWKTQQVKKEQAARIAELEADLEQSEICIRARVDVIDQQAAQIKSLEDALVEERAGAIRCESYDHCEGMYRIDLPDAMIRAQQELQAEDKIGPDAMPRSWQITEERNATLAAALKVLERLRKVNTDTDHSYLNRGIVVLRAMLTEAGQE